MLKLPAYSQLSREQVAIDDLPGDGNYLVYGPPGTGKTVMALYRSSRLQRGQRSTQFLSYGKPLSRYIRQAVTATRLDGSASTLHQWFWWWWKRAYRSTPPMLPGSNWDHDWNAIYAKLARAVPAAARLDNLIIDEGQDLPPQFYLAIQLIASNITVFADENQSIRETNSTLRDISDHLNPQQKCALRKNYRNSRRIAQLAREFYTGTQSGLPDLPDRNGMLPQLLRSAPLSRQVSYLVDYERLHSNRDIGVFVERVDDIRELRRLLANRTVNPVQAYARSIGGGELDFARPGIKLLTFQSAKGLEFDSVFFPALERAQRLLDDRARMSWYVLVSRARDEVVFLTADAELPVPLRGIPASLYEAETMSSVSTRSTPADKPQANLPRVKPASAASSAQPKVSSTKKPSLPPQPKETRARPAPPQRAPAAARNTPPASPQELARLASRFNTSRNQSSLLRPNADSPAVSGKAGYGQGARPTADRRDNRSSSVKKQPGSRCPRCGSRAKRGEKATASGLCSRCERHEANQRPHAENRWTVRCPVCGQQEVRSDGRRPPRGQTTLTQNCSKCGDARNRCSRCGVLPPKPEIRWITGICTACQRDAIPVKCFTCGWQTTRARVNGLTQCPTCRSPWREWTGSILAPGSKFETWREDTK